MQLENVYFAESNTFECNKNGEMYIPLALGKASIAKFSPRSASHALASCKRNQAKRTTPMPRVRAT
jgi:hypothetical protein